MNALARLASLVLVLTLAAPALAQPGAKDPADDVVNAVCFLEGPLLCLREGRFRVEVTWRDFEGHGGIGQAVKLNQESGYFWFFSETNVEITVKVLDGRDINGYFWVFYGSLSNVEFTITVTDVRTRKQRIYLNPLGTFASRGDTTAFEAEQFCGGIAGLPCPDRQVCDPEPGQCHVADVGGYCAPRPEVCFDLYDPVCGCDGVTYSNDCERLMAGAALAHAGECGG